MKILDWEEIKKNGGNSLIFKEVEKLSNNFLLSYYKDKIIFDWYTNSELNELYYGGFESLEDLKSMLRAG